MMQYGHLLDHFDTTFLLAPTRTLLVTMQAASAPDIVEARQLFYNNGFIKVQTTVENIQPDLICQQKKRTELDVLLSNLTQQYDISFEVRIQEPPCIILKGPPNQINHARQDLLVCLDQVAGLKHSQIDLPLYLHNSLGGRRHYQLQSVMEETATNVYLHHPFLIGHNSLPLEHRAPVYITGDGFQVTQCVNILQKIADQKVEHGLLKKETSLNPKKMDLILLHQQTRLKSILYDNGSFVHFPSIGSGTSAIQVYAENSVNLDRTIRLLNLMVYELYQATFKLAADALSMYFSPHKPFWASTFVRDLALASGGEVFYYQDHDTLEVMGSLEAVRLVYRFLNDKCLIKQAVETTITVELASEHRAFIRGKKNGKMNKVMKETGTQIKFVSSYSDQNCLAVLTSNEMDKAIEGLGLLVDELPEEQSFFVADIYHRRIIGVGGAHIQAIMKKHGVYVKFAGSDEYNQLGGYFKNEDNVLARTPRKRKANLDTLYNEIMGMVSFERDRHWVTETVSVPLHLHRTVPSQFSDQIREFRRVFNTRIFWPARTGSDKVMLIGPLVQVKEVKTLFRKCLPIFDFCPFPSTSILLSTLASLDFDKHMRDIESNYHVTVTVPKDLTVQLMPMAPVTWSFDKKFEKAMVFCLVIQLSPDCVLQENDTDLPSAMSHLASAKKMLYSVLSAHLNKFSSKGFDNAVFQLDRRLSAMDIDKGSWQRPLFNPRSPSHLMAELPWPAPDTFQASPGRTNSLSSNASKRSAYSGWHPPRSGLNPAAPPHVPTTRPATATPVTPNNPIVPPTSSPPIGHPSSVWSTPVPFPLFLEDDRHLSTYDLLSHATVQSPPMSDTPFPAPMPRTMSARSYGMLTGRPAGQVANPVQLTPTMLSPTLTDSTAFATNASTVSSDDSSLASRSPCIEPRHMQETKGFSTAGFSVHVQNEDELQ
ncbi:hypothetical protein DM01DRAFT_1340736 [Hesseltinella vesiculosa]|uniref:K Homology domain-containing protein n=1 Tax=Hesseltinella vesiculosa TaxID=101127 RepID=A0A1X2G339_9FUNG|nr:hypothetical protein DM01DRAFT_1340736 [Hesseltinella vesiculosa]